MAKLIDQLTAAFVKSTHQPGKYTDGNGLLYRVYPSGARCWEQRITANGRRHTYGLGGYPTVSLKKARKAALRNLRRARSGKDPADRQRKRSEPTFAEAAVLVCEKESAGWTSPRQAVIWMSSLERYVFPRLGKVRVSAIRRRDVLDVLGPLWNEKRETAKKVRQRISSVMAWAAAREYRKDNPAGECISAGLPSDKKKVVHYRALPSDQVGWAVAEVRRSRSDWSTKLAFEFLVLTAARSGEVRGAQWSEMDLDERLWKVPAERMKTREAHEVPLSARALAVLKEAEALLGARNSELVFPTASNSIMSDATMSKLVRNLGIEAVPHGFRSSFRSWCSDTGVDREVAERCLAHTVGNQVEQIYQRSDILERRRVVMETWGEYVGELVGATDTDRRSGPARAPGTRRTVRRPRGRPRKTTVKAGEQGVLFS